MTAPLLSPCQPTQRLSATLLPSIDTWTQPTQRLSATLQPSIDTKTPKGRTVRTRVNIVKVMACKSSLGTSYHSCESASNPK